MTIRRDLRILEGDGLLRRVHGGATSSRGRSYEPPFLLRSRKYADAKARIGAIAASLIQDGDSIVLDVGAHNAGDRTPPQKPEEPHGYHPQPAYSQHSGGSPGDPPHSDRRYPEAR